MTRRVVLFLLLLGGLALTTFSSGARATENAAIGTPVQLMTAAATGTGTAIGPGTMTQCRETAFYVVWSSGTGAGVVVIETAHTSTFAGTWAPLATVSWSTANKQDVVQITGAHAAIRPRISTTVTGGTVDVYAICN